MRLSDATVIAMNACALRFDGWAFVARRGGDRILATLSDHFVATLQTSVDSNENHATFFALQRFLFKWGGEQLSESSREHAAFGFLFLHLYRLDVEPTLRAPEHWERWQVEHAARAELYAAEVRESLLRDHRDD